MVRLDEDATTNRRFADKLSAAGQRFERSVVGEAAISGVVTLVVLIGVVWNLPDSELKRAMRPTLLPIAASTGLEQKWQMYAPDPISSLEDVHVEVRMDDGSVRMWRWQRGDKLIGPFTWYHWQKLKEQVIRVEDGRAEIAHWAVRQLTTPDERPVHVTMVFRNEALPAPGESGPMPVTVTDLYDEALDGRP
jgi:hypothetical protein